MIDLSAEAFFSQIDTLIRINRRFKTSDLLSGGTKSF